MRKTKPAATSLRHERAQILPLMALLLVVFLGLLGLAIDVGHLFVARTQLSRAVDAAALAGVVELPDTTGAHNTATTFLLENEPGATISFPPPTETNQLKVEGGLHVLHGLLRHRRCDDPRFRRRRRLTGGSGRLRPQHRLHRVDGVGALQLFAEQLRLPDI
jgi:hypothetical protein